MELNKEEKEIIIKSLQFFINNQYGYPSYEELRKISDLKERIRSEP